MVNNSTNINKHEQSPPTSKQLNTKKKKHVVVVDIN